MKFCTYLVEIALAPLAAYLLIRSLREDKVRQWILLGVVCGLGILNKYSFGLILVGFAIVVLTRREYRRRLVSWKPYLAGLIFLAVLAPHLKWLVEHHFVCFSHVGSRLEQKHNILMPLFVLGAALYPLATEAVAVILALAPGAPRAEGGKWFSLAGWKAAAKNREALHFAGIVSLLPGAVYLVLSLSGIAVMALCPVEVDKRLFKRLSILLAAFIAAVLIGAMIDVQCRTSDGVHMDPAPVVAAAETFWKEHSDKPIPVAVGGLRFAALLDHYSCQHPPVCEPDDDVMIGLYREKIRNHGALLIDAGEKDFDEFLKRAGTKVVFRHCRIKFGSRFGKKKTRYFVLGYLPPGTEIK